MPKEPAPSPQRDEKQKPPILEEKKGIACLKVPLTAQYGDPPTTVVVDALPYDCYGQKITPEDLQALGAGAAGGLKGTFDVTEPIETTYKLAEHDVWIERTSASTKGKPVPAYTLEVVCTLLARAAVCWVARAAGEAGLRAFEHLPVTLDGTHAAALVPDNVFPLNH